MSKIEQNQPARDQMVAVALSGGVDSAVSALLLKQMGYRLIAIFMNNWETDPENPECTASEDLQDAKAVAAQLDIPLSVVNLRRQYWNDVFQHCLDEYVKGNTPNPDVLCNKFIKFKALLDHAQQLGADRLATGHYARIQQDGSTWELLKGGDPNKDQSYFLYLLNQAQLSKSIFPVGTYQKPEIRAIAQEYGFVNHAKKDSTGICFVGERKFKTFLKEFLLNKPGPMETPDGKVIGQHDGLMFYTIGQRKGLSIGGQKEEAESPWYVLQKEIKRNTLIVGQGHDHPLLYTREFICSEVHWISGTAPTFPLRCLAKTRYRQRDIHCQVTLLSDGRCHVEFEKPEWAITPGQSVVFYEAEKCLGGGIING